MKTYDVGVPGKIKSQPILGPQCDYPTLSPNDPLIAVVINTRSGGIEGLYERRASFGFFEPGTLDGYPTLANLLSPDPQHCSINVAVNDTELLNIDYTVGVSSKDEACIPAKKLLATALENVKAQQ